MDRSVEQQDPRKLAREKQLIRSGLEGTWDIALEYGCGTGANFECFDVPGRAGRLLIGIDADAARAAKAAQRALSCRYVQAVVIPGTSDLLDQLPSGLTIDRVACIQVLGHVPSSALDEILGTFHAVMEHGGRCLLAVPVVSEKFTEDPASAGWDGRSDYHHWVDQTLSPEADGFRRTVTRDQFDRVKPPQHVLPVRCFLVPAFPDALQEALPYPLPVPATIKDLVKKWFTVVDSLLYSVHRRDHTGQHPLIGDTFLVLEK